MIKKLALTALVAASALSLQAQTAAGGITPEMMQTIRKGFEGNSSDKALRNAVAANSINALAKNSAAKNVDNHFSHKVESKGITDQKQSGRCWLFTGQNVLRAQMMAANDLPELQLSQSYNFFYDQLEKSNLFLQGIIDTSNLPMDDKMVDWLFMNPISDGGQFTGVSENIMKYGLVPREAMPETVSSENTSKLNQLLSLRLREDGLRLREMAANGASPQQLANAKTDMLATIYRMLVLTLGEPVQEFTWTRYDKEGKEVSTKTYTPQQWYAELAGNDLRENYVMLMNDPLREYYKLYEIDYDRHNYDGKNWTYINLPMEDIKEMAIASIKDGKMMYFSCDVNKFLDKDKGLMDLDNFDYGALFGTDFGMNKKERVQTHASGSSHAMTLMAVDLDASGKPKKWMVENSWGKTGRDGHLVMTDDWFDEYMFRLVVEKKFVPKKILKILEQTPERLPAWDPMFTPDM